MAIAKLLSSIFAVLANNSPGVQAGRIPLGHRLSASFTASAMIVLAAAIIVRMRNRIFRPADQGRCIRQYSLALFVRRLGEVDHMPVSAKERPLVDDVDPVLVSRLARISKSVRQIVGISLADIDVAIGQDQFLLGFVGDKVISVDHVARSLAVRASTISKMTDICARNGWVVREGDPNDARRALIRLTEAGKATRDRVAAAWAKLEAELEPLSSDEDVLSVLGTLDVALRTRLARLR